MADTLYCYRHKDRSTVLRCGACERPICTRCAIQTPVGARCPECAHLRRLPTYDVGASNYALAAAAAAVMAVALGGVWALLPLRGFFTVLIAAGVGYVAGEGVSLAANRKRSLGIQALAGVAVLLAFLVAHLGPFWLRFGLAPELLATLAFRSLLDAAALLGLAIGIIMAVSRVR